MYSSVSSGTHHIFLPPRFEVVAEKQNSNGLASNSWNKPPFHGLFRNQAYCPAGVSFGRTAADHCDDPLFLAVLQQRGRARSFFLIEGPPQPALNLPMTHLTDWLRGQRDEFGNARRAHAAGQLQQRKSAEHSANRQRNHLALTNARPLMRGWQAVMGLSVEKREEPDAGRGKK